MKILFISDLHFNASTDGKMLDLLLAEVKEHGITDVIFSGDLVNNPCEPDIYKKLEKDFLRPLSGAVSIDLDKFVFCPGNHDVSFEMLKSKSIIGDAIREKVTSGDLSDAELLQPTQSEYARSISEDFFNFIEGLGNGWKNPYYHLYFLSSGENIIALNSSFLCSQGGSAYDQGKLHVPIDGFWNTLHERDFFGVVMHHPIGSLNEKTQRELNRRIRHDAKAVFFGHVHDPLPNRISDAETEVLSIQSAALSQRNERFQGYCILNINDENPTACFRTYYESRGNYDVATNVGPNGEMPIPVSTFRSDSAALSIIETEIIPELKSQFDDNLVDKKLSEIWVEPKLVKIDPTKQQKDDLLDEEIIPIDALMSDAENTIIYSGHESGSSSLLKFLEMKINSNLSSTKKVAALIDCDGLPNYEQAIIQKVLKALPTQVAVLGLEKLKEFQVVVLLDRFSVNDDRSEFIDVLRNNFDIRIIAATNTNDVSSALLTPVKSFRSHTKLLLQEFDRNKTRQLISNWGLSSDFSVDSVLNEVMQRFNALGISTSPAYLVFYLTVLEKTQSFAPLNASTIVDNFIEIVLEKYNVEKIFRKAFDYNNQSAVLSNLARYFVELGVNSIKYEDAIARVRDFLDKIDIEFNPVDIIKEFEKAKLLEHFGSKVRFKNELFFSYFLAVEMKEDREFKLEITKAPLVYSYVSAVETYCGLNRSDKEIWQNLLEDYDRCYDRIEKILPIDNALDKISKLERLKQDDFTEKLADLVLGETLTDYQRDHLVGDSHRPGRKLKGEKVKVVTNEILQWLHSLRLLSVSLKNLEHIDKDSKKIGLQKVIKGWSSIMALGVGLVHQLSEQQSFEFDDFIINVEFADKTERLNEILYQILNIIPIVVSDELRTHLGTSKLEKTFRSLCKDSMNVEKTLLSFLVLDLHLGQFSEQIDDLLKQLKGSGFLQNALSLKLMDFYLRNGDLPSKMDNDYRKIIVELEADKLSLKGPERTDFISGRLSSLKQKKLLRKPKH